MAYETNNDVLTTIRLLLNFVGPNCREKLLEDPSELFKPYNEADTKKLDFLAVASISSAKEAILSFSGELMYEKPIVQLLEILKGQIEESIEKSEPPPRDEWAGPDYVCYNVARGALGFDFITFLVNAEMVRRRMRAASPLKVGFFCGKDAEERMKYGKRQAWLDHVMRPALKLIGAVEDERAIHGYHNLVYSSAPICQAVRAGEEVPVLSAPDDYGWPKDVVTVTLRETEYYAHRNSNIEAWTRFATDLQRSGERVIIVRDTRKADVPFGDFTIAPEASRNLISRMSLYQGAKANLFVANGPTELARFSRRPYLIFTPVEKEGPNTHQSWERHIGVKIGDQYPWALPAQRLVFKPDTYENIVEAWRELNIEGADASGNRSERADRLSVVR